MIFSHYIVASKCEERKEEAFFMVGPERH